MGDTLKKRRKIFDVYSANLNQYLTTMSVGRMPDGKPPMNVTGKVYFCPLCYKKFGPTELSEIPGKNYLTLEHNPPRCMRGKGRILTCKQCNSTNGGELDELVRELLTKESFLFSDNASVSAMFDYGGKRIAGKIEKRNGARTLRPLEKSNPYLYNVLRQEIAQGKQPKMQFKLTAPDRKEYSIGILKIAYLKAFELFGYNFADLGNGKEIQRVLRREIDYPAPNNGVIDENAPEEYVGVHIVREPEELRALLITIDFSFEHEGTLVRKNVPVVLPHPNEGGWESLANYHKYLGKEMNIRSERFKLLQIPLMKTENYYSMFV